MNYRQICAARWCGQLKWSSIQDGETGSGVVQSLVFLKDDSVLISIVIEDGNPWSGAVRKAAGGGYAGKITYIADRDEMELDERTGALSHTPGSAAQITFRLRKIGTGLTLRGTWVDDDSCESYTWTATLAHFKRRRTDLPEGSSLRR